MLEGLLDFGACVGVALTSCGEREEEGVGLVGSGFNLPVAVVEVWGWLVVLVWAEEVQFCRQVLLPQLQQEDWLSEDE